MRKKSAGFTLIETLIVIFLMGIVLVAGGNIFFSIMKGANKAEVEREVKQNGGYALAIMERMIRNSNRVLECDPDFLTIENVNNTDNKETRFQVNSERIASSSGELFENHLYLTGENVTVSSFSFSCIYDPVDSDESEDLRRVGISFTLTPKGAVAGEVPSEMYAEFNFQTSISLRNF
jgi:prepilin-type N-terminal cleavage/methylation domain-containing protein